VNIVVLDGAELAPDADFPPLEAEKYGWLQYPCLEYGEIAPTCWRSHIVISLATPLDGACLAELKLIQLLVTGREAASLVDRDLLRQRGIELAEFPGVDWRDPAQAADGCRRIVETINRFLAQSRAGS
jgi:hypothetical protein